MGNLPSHPPVVKVFDFMLQVHKVATRPEEEGAEPSGEWFNGVFFAMPNCVSLRIQVHNMRGLIRALALMVTGDPAVFQSLDPLGRMVDSITKGNVEVGHSSIIGDIAVGGPVELVFIVLDTVMEPSDLFFEAMHFACSLGLALSNGQEEPISDGSENGCVEVRVGRQGGCNCTGRHRWFRTLDQSDWERDVVLDGRDV